MPNAAFVRIALVGDHSLNLHALAILLNDERGFRIVSISKTASQLATSIALSDAEHYPDLVLLDTNFDLHGALCTISCLRGLQPAIPLAVLGLTKDPAAILRLRVMGVQGYIPKNTDPADFEDILRHIARKGHEGEPTIRHSEPPSAMDSHIADFPINAWPSITATERRYFRLAMTEISDDDIRRTMRLPQSEFGKLVAGVHRQFGVTSTHGLVLALYRQRFIVTDNI